MKEIFEGLGFDELKPEDLDILVRGLRCTGVEFVHYAHCVFCGMRFLLQIQTADKDKDGKISLEDFRAMISSSKPASLAPFHL